MLSPGREVKINNLTNRTDLNDLHGELIKWFDDVGRWQVKLFSSSESVRVRPENLTLISLDTLSAPDFESVLLEARTHFRTPATLEMQELKHLLECENPKNAARRMRYITGRKKLVLIELVRFMAHNESQTYGHLFFLPIDQDPREKLNTVVIYNGMSMPFAQGKQMYELYMITICKYYEALGMEFDFQI